MRIPAQYLLATAAMFGFSSSALSEAPPATDLFQMDLQEVLDIEVSTASKLRVKANQSPGNLTVITQDQIRRYGYRTIGEALQRAVGFLNSDTLGASVPSARGLAPRGISLNARFLFLIDGVRHNDALGDGVSVDEAFPLDIESVERIEVLKGDGSAVWGTNALYGVVNVISKDSKSKRGKQFMGEYRTDDRGKGYASWSNETEGGVKYFASAAYTKEDKRSSVFYPGLDEDPATDDTRTGTTELDGFHTNLKLSYEDFYATVVYGHDDRDLDPRLTLANDYDGTYVNQSAPFRAELGHNLSLGGTGDGEITTRVYHLQDSFKSFFTQRVPDSTLVSTTQSRQRIYSTGGEVRLTQPITDDVKALVGVELARTYKGRETVAFADIDSGEFAFEGGGSRSFNRTNSSYFADLIYSPIDEVDVFLGGRVDKVSGFDPELGPRLALVTRPLTDTTVRFLISQGYRTPSLAETSRVVEQQPKLNPEKIETYELLIDQQIDEGFLVRGGVFHSDLSDTIGANQNFDVPGLYANLAGFNTTGFEFEAVYELNDKIQGYTTYTYTEAKDTSLDTHIRGYPSSVARTGISVGTGDDLLTISPEVAFASSTRAGSGYRFEPYAVANITVLSSLGLEGFGLSASVYNIFDEEFPRLDLIDELTPDRERSIQPSRELRIQASWIF